MNDQDSKMAAYAICHAAEMATENVRATCGQLESLIERRGLWAVILRLTPFLDGNQWCVLWGEDLAVGIAGFGNTPIDAMNDFERAMYKKAPKPAGGGE